MVSVPKKFKYRIEIFDAIVYSLLYFFNTQEIKTNYNKLYKQVAHHLNIHLSKRDFQQHITKLIDDNIIVKESIKNNSKKTLPVSYYYLTVKGKKIHSLKLTGANYEDTRSRKQKLYMLLLCFDLFKRGRILSERQLPSFLNQFKSSVNELERIDYSDNTNQESFPDLGQYTEGITLYETNNDIQLLKFKNANDNKYYYYTVFPGFSADEFKFYIELIKKGKEPHPFSKDRKSMEIPVISYLNFSKEEIEDAISLLKQNDLIKPIKSIIPEEMRYDVKNDTLKSIFSILWSIHIIDFYTVMDRLINCGQPLENDSKFLTFHHGHKTANKMLAFLYDYKKKYKKNPSDESRNPEFLKIIEEQRKPLVKEIQLLSKKVITKTENYFIVSLIRDICLPIDDVT